MYTNIYICMYVYKYVYICVAVCCSVLYMPVFASSVFLSTVGWLQLLGSIKV